MSRDRVVDRGVVEREVVRIIREDVLGGSDRPIPLHAPLGQVGVALDSLAIVQLVTAVEAAFGVELPDDVLADRASLTLGELVDLVAGASPEREPAPSLPARARTLPPPHLKGERLRQRLDAYGLPGRLLWTTARLASPPAHFMFTRLRNFILERPLGADEKALFEPPPGVALHDGIPARVDLSGLWPDYAEERSRRRVERWLQEGAWALAAVEGERVVALDLLTTTGDDEIKLRAERSACWGLDLVEAPAVRGRGIGLALLAYSLQSASERGFRAQLTLVHEANRPMLAACMQLLGFRTLGTATRTSVLGATRWSWDVEGRKGRGRRFML